MEVAKHAGASKHTGDIQTYRGHPANGFLPLVEIMVKELIGFANRKWKDLTKGLPTSSGFSFIDSFKGIVKKFR